MEHYLYLFLNVFAIFVPLAFSFDKRTSFYRSWGPLAYGIVITGAFFIIWDVMFTQQGIWGFNPRYLVGINIINLPLEEWLFFITIPYACVFTYHSLEYYWPKETLSRVGRPMSLALLSILLVLAVLYSERAYTSTTFLLLGTFLIYHVIKDHDYMGLFYVSYLFILLPFFLINGILTGSFIDEQVVWYNDTENLAIRIGTIPIEDTFYGMLLILMNVTIYEYVLGIQSQRK